MARHCTRAHETPCNHIRRRDVYCRKPVTVTESQDAAVLQLVADVCGLLDIGEFRHGLLDALDRALPSDYVSLNEVGPTPDSVTVLMRPEVDAKYYPIWREHAHENPLLQRYLQTRDGRAYRFSDVIAPSALRRLALYRELYRPLGVQHQLAFALTAGPDRVLAIALNRGLHDYSDRECEFVERARPFLIQAYRNTVAYEQLHSRAGIDDDGVLMAVLLGAGLTSREAQAMRAVALGRSNQHAAELLGISHRTVGKHLERGYKKLGVTDRSSAAARIWELASALPREPRLPKSPG
jgi:DNA-binding CsgD family transcriptional regulator